MTLLTLLVVTALAIVRSTDLFGAVMLTGIYGLLSASFFVALDAVDVAFTEASVGAGLFPLLMLVVLGLTGRYEKPREKKPVYLLLFLIVGAFLIAGTIDLSPFGEPDAPAHQKVSQRYIHESVKEIGIPNMVTSVLASYRGYDTLGEVVVIFTAAMGVLSLLTSSIFAKHWPHRYNPNMRDHQVLRVVGKILIPVMMLFAMYVQFHGDFGPGGGFQAGVIFAASVILFTMLYGLEDAQYVFKPGILRIFAAVGVFIYGSVGVVSLLSGGNFLDYSVLAADPVAGQHIGILVIELGVGITVAAAMILIFFAFAQEANKDQGAAP